MWEYLSGRSLYFVFVSIYFFLIIVEFSKFQQLIKLKYAAVKFSISSKAAEFSVWFGMYSI